MKITVFSADSGNHRFIEPIVKKWNEQGYEANITNNFSPVEDSDVYFFDFCDNNIIVASNDFAEDLAKHKVIVRLHAVEYYLNFYNQVNWEAVDNLVFVSDIMRDKIGELPVETHTIYNGINLDKFYYREREKGFNIGYAGNIVSAKGILIMFHYFRQLLNKDDRYRLHLVGLNRFHGREGDYYNYYTEDLKKKGYITEEGETDDINIWLEGMDYLWQPSLNESFSIIIGEAMAKGIKPIINNFEGSKDLWMLETIYSDFDKFYEILNNEYKSEDYRNFIIEKYNLNKMMIKLNGIIKTKK